MGADTTLVEGAFKVAQSLVPQDLSKFYKAQYEMRAQTMKDVNEFFKAKDDEAKAAMGVLTDKYDLIMSSLASSGRTGAEGEYDAIAAQLERVTTEYNTAIKSKDKKAQHKLEGEASRIIQQIDRLEAGHSSIAEFLKNEEIDAEATGGQNFKVLDMVWDPETDPDKIEHIWENGSLIYKVNTGNPDYGVDGVVTIKADDLMQSIVPKAHAAKTALLSYEKDYRAYGESGKTYYQEDVIDDIISGVFKTKKDFAGMTNYKMKGRKSFKDALMNDQTIYDALNKLDATEIAKLEGLGSQAVADGKISALDFENGENAVKLIDALTNIHSENFNKDAAYNAAAAYFEKGVNGRYVEGKTIWDAKEVKRLKELSDKSKTKPTQTDKDRSTLAKQVKSLDKQVTWNKVNWKRAEVNIDGTATSVYYAEYEGGTDIMTPYGLQAQAGGFASQDYPEDLKVLSPDQLEQVQTQLTEQGLEFGDDDGPGEINEASIKSLIGSGDEAQVVSAFNDSEMFEGYTFTTEWELGGRAMNIKTGNKEKIIMLDKANAWEKIMAFMKENPTT